MVVLPLRPGPLRTDATAWSMDTVVQGDFWVATTAAESAESPWAQLQASYANATVRRRIHGLPLAFHCPFHCLSTAFC